MAYTVTRIANTVFGNKRAILLQVTADAATQTIETGLRVVEAFSVGITSAGTAVTSMKVAINSNASGVQSFGVLGISGLASGDAMFFTVYGT